MIELTNVLANDPQSQQRGSRRIKRGKKCKWSRAILADGDAHHEEVLSFISRSNSLTCRSIGGFRLRACWFQIGGLTGPSVLRGIGNRQPTNRITDKFDATLVRNYLHNCAFSNNVNGSSNVFLPLWNWDNRSRHKLGKRRQVMKQQNMLTTTCCHHTVCFFTARFINT